MPSHRLPFHDEGRRPLEPHRDTWRFSTFVVSLAVLVATCGAPELCSGQIVTAERIRLPGWWPTKGEFPRSDYVGPESCSPCHPSQADPTRRNAMFWTGLPPSQAEVLKRFPELSWQRGPYAYRIFRRGDAFLYSVSDGQQLISEPLEWAVGLGGVGQTYLYRRGETFHESRVSFYRSLGGLDLTTGHSNRVEPTLEDAHGKPLAPTEAKRCFACHMTGAVTEDRLEPEHLIPGVTCEACHGPGARHVAAMASGDRAQTFILNPARLTPGDADDFCGACHRTWWDVKLMDAPGVENVRFQPYRLQRSRCWNPDDPRATCVSCHDPHASLETAAAFYDAKCLACHVDQPRHATTPTRPGPACPQATSNCSSCHMPKILLPQMHARFTDHRIRIARPGDPYPD